MKKIIENATILYKNGLKQIYDAIYITKKGIYTGHIITKKEDGEEFEDYGFIPTDQIERITICNEYGKIKDTLAAYDNIDIFLLIIPGLDKDAEAIAKTDKLNLLMGENANVVLSKLKANLVEKATTLKALSLLDTKTNIQEQVPEKEPSKIGHKLSLFNKKS